MYPSEFNHVECNPMMTYLGWLVCRKQQILYQCLRCLSYLGSIFMIFMHVKGNCPVKACFLEALALDQGVGCPEASLCLDEL